MSTFKTPRASVRVQASERATSLSLQRAVVTNDQQALRELAARRHARIDLRDGRVIGKLASTPRIAGDHRQRPGDLCQSDGLASAREGRAHRAP